MNKLLQHSFSLLPLLFFIHCITSTNSIFAMELFHNTVYVRSEDPQTPVSIQYLQHEHCCGSKNYSTTRSFPMQSAHEQGEEFLILKQETGSSNLSFCITSLTQSPINQTVEVLDDDELIIHQPTNDNLIEITLIRNRKKPGTVVARLFFNHR